MRLVATLILGIAIGFGLAQYHANAPIKPNFNVHNVVNVPPQPPPQPLPPIEIQQKVELPNSVKQGAAPAANTANNRTPASELPTDPTTEARNPLPVPENLDLSVSTADLEHMESQWDDLPNQVRLERERRGWRVAYLESSSIFAKIGLRVGDLITDESLRAMSANGDKNFEDRLVDLLNHVSTTY